MILPVGALVAIAVAVFVALSGNDDPAPDPSTGGSSSSLSSNASSSVPDGANTTGLPLTVPEGYSIELLARVPGARVIVRDGFGNYWVSQPQQGTVSQIQMSGSTVVGVHAVLRGLDGPHGLAIEPGSNGMTLYVAEIGAIKRVYLYSDGPIETVADLPPAGQHRTRTLGFGPDGRLYVSAGSTCNVCEETDERHAAIFSMERDGSDEEIVATGLRNPVFFRWHRNGDLYATDMGRDMLGDDVPPEEVNVIRESGHYGWPYCYGERVRDATFLPEFAFDCASTIPPLVELPAHVAPLGLAFLPDGDLLVAEHGSWNSSVKVGYKVVRVPLTAAGRPEGEPVDFLTGFLRGDVVHGRPVDVLVEDDGSILVTDDRHGAVYRMTPA